MIVILVVGIFGVALALAVHYSEEYRIRHAEPEDVTRWRATAQKYRNNALDARRDYDIATEEVCERLARAWDARADKAEARFSKTNGGSVS
jgi:hypothetical protein